MIYNIGDKIGGIKLATTLECKIADAARAEGSAETTDSMGREAQRCFDKGYRAGEDAALGEVDQLRSAVENVRYAAEMSANGGDPLDPAAVNRCLIEALRAAADHRNLLKEDQDA